MNSHLLALVCQCDWTPSNFTKTRMLKEGKMFLSLLNERPPLLLNSSSLVVVPDEHLTNQSGTGSSAPAGKIEPEERRDLR